MKTPERLLQTDSVKVSECTDVRRGVPLPLRPHESGEGLNFAFISHHADRVRLELFDYSEDATPVSGIDRDPVGTRTGDVWPVWMAGIRPATLGLPRGQWSVELVLAAHMIPEVESKVEPQLKHDRSTNRLISRYRSSKELSI